MTWCDGCGKQHQQTSLHLTLDNHLEYLCTPCWQWAHYWDSIAPRTGRHEEVAA